MAYFFCTVRHIVGGGGTAEGVVTNKQVFVEAVDAAQCVQTINNELGTDLHVTTDKSALGIVFHNFPLEHDESDSGSQ